jgi:hypothetical protein
MKSAAQDARRRAGGSPIPDGHLLLLASALLTILMAITLALIVRPPWYTIAVPLLGLPATFGVTELGRRATERATKR